MPDVKLLFPLGAKLDPYDPRDIMFASLVPVNAIDLPRKFSLRDKQSPVVLQKYGSCVGFAGKNALEYYLWKLRGNMTILSGRFLYAMAKRFDGHPEEQGTEPRLMLKGMFGLGTPEDTQWPQEPSPTHTDYIKSPPDDIYESAVVNLPTGGFARVMTAVELKQAVMLFGPVLVTLNVFDTYDNPGSDGYVPQTTNQSSFRGRHENIVVGWDDDSHGGAWEVKNQWNTTWANQGYGFISYNYDGVLPFSDMWSINEMIDATTTTGAPVALGYPVETSTPFITQGFGARPEYYAKYGMKGHNGLDFRTKDLKNRFILACDDGEVILAGPDGGYGNAVRIRHSWGMSIYGHNSQLLVSDIAPDGSAPKVKKGQRIAVPGSTGDTGNPPAEHCHFGIRINGVKNPGFFDWVDPMPYLRKDIMLSNSFFVFDEASGTYSIAGPKINPDALLSDAMNFGLDLPMKAGVPDTAPIADRIDWDKLKSLSRLLK